jgi:6-pyruvoyltetrahydropterin/6-carboxytetrahydropterin synthase
MMEQATIPLLLTRTLRMPVSLSAETWTASRGAYNGMVGGAGDFGINAILEFEIGVEGTPGSSGYLVDITVLDAALRDAARERCIAAARAEFARGEPTDLAALLHAIARDAAMTIPARVAKLAFRPSPFRSITVRYAGDLRHPSSVERTAMPNTLLTETFEFAAAHRLHLAELSADENRRLFGKCNNPNGHGHNYRIEVGCAVEHAPRGFGFADLQELVQREIMQRFDHKHLNLDCPEFRELNPSVENIARVCHGLLDGPVRERSARLEYVRVWETEKTSCRYPA